MSSIINAAKDFVSSLTYIKESDGDYQENMHTSINNAIDTLNNDINNEYCGIVMYYDVHKDSSVIGVVDNTKLCSFLLSIFRDTMEHYDHDQDCNIEMEFFDSYIHPNMEMISFVNKVGFNNCFDVEYARFRFATNDHNALIVIRSLLAFCDNKDDLNKLLETIEDDEKGLLDCYTHLYANQCKKNGNKKKVIKKTTLEIPREEIPREKTLSKKEKEKLKKQKAKEANKLREQQKKDKAKLAEQQAKQFEKQQKERNKKRIETERKKKLALLKK